MGDMIACFGGRQGCSSGMTKEIQQFGRFFRCCWRNGIIQQPLPLGSLFWKEADVLVVGGEAKLEG